MCGTLAFIILPRAGDLSHQRCAPRSPHLAGSVLTGGDSRSGGVMGSTPPSLRVPDATVTADAQPCQAGWLSACRERRRTGCGAGGEALSRPEPDNCTASTHCPG